MLFRSRNSVAVVTSSFNIGEGDTTVSYAPAYSIKRMFKERTCRNGICKEHQCGHKQRNDLFHSIFPPDVFSETLHGFTADR